MKQKGHIIYISHGGGPMPLLGDPSHQEMVEQLQVIAKKVGKPSAIILVSAHWEAGRPTVTSGQAQGLIYDYGGFAKQAFEIQYPCPGEPELANRIYRALSQKGIDASMDEYRGFDHGLFVPLKIMYPEADIPCVQLSLVNSLNPDVHIKMGKALANLNWDNVLFIGSGFSFHNMRAFFSSGTDESDAKNLAFDQWLRALMSDDTISENTRELGLLNWETAPQARYCHPREEHLLPLHVCYGIAGKASDESYELKIMNKHASMFLWER